MSCVCNVSVLLHSDLYLYTHIHILCCVLLCSGEPADEPALHIGGNGEERDGELCMTPLTSVSWGIDGLESETLVLRVRRAML